MIRQAKLMVTRRLSNVIMARAGLYTYEDMKMMEIFMICESFDHGIWKLVKCYSEAVKGKNKLEIYYPFQCEPNVFHRVRAFFLAGYDTEKKFVTHNELLQVLGVWNNWGRDDGLDEPKATPLDLLYDGIPLPPVEERIFLPGDNRFVVKKYRYYKRKKNKVKNVGNKKELLEKKSADIQNTSA